MKNRCGLILLGALLFALPCCEHDLDRMELEHSEHSLQSSEEPTPENQSNTREGAPSSALSSRSANTESVSGESNASHQTYILHGEDDCQSKLPAIARLNSGNPDINRETLIDVLRSNLPPLCLEQAAATAVSLGNEAVLSELDGLSLVHANRNVRYAARMAASTIRRNHPELRTISLRIEVLESNAALGLVDLRLTASAVRPVRDGRLGLFVPAPAESVGADLVKSIPLLDGEGHQQSLTLRIPDGDFSLPIRAKFSALNDAGIRERVQVAIHVHRIGDALVTDASSEGNGRAK